MGWDETGYIWVNQQAVIPALDELFVAMRTPKTWIPLYFVLSALIYFKLGLRQFLVILFFSGVLIFFTDYTVAGVLKSWVERLRPCHIPELHARLLVECGSGYSFISAHACNHMGIALFYGLLLHKYIPWSLATLIVWASCISYAQIYVGVHYPSDVLVGCVFGAIIGAGVWKLYSFTITKIIRT